MKRVKFGKKWQYQALCQHNFCITKILQITPVAKDQYLVSIILLRLMAKARNKDRDGYFFELDNYTIR